MFLIQIFMQFCLYVYVRTFVYVPAHIDKPSNTCGMFLLEKKYRIKQFLSDMFTTIFAAFYSIAICFHVFHKL